MNFNKTCVEIMRDKMPASISNEIYNAIRNTKEIGAETYVKVENATNHLNAGLLQNPILIVINEMINKI